MRTIACATCLIALILAPSFASAYTYTLGSRVTLRAAAKANARAIQRLDHNQTLKSAKRLASGWFMVETVAGVRGYLAPNAVSTRWIKVHKQERALYLMQGMRVIKRYKIALSPHNPLGDKEQSGDHGTPEGRLYIADKIVKPGAPRYGARSMRLSYPSIDDARRGLARKWLSYRRYLALVKAIRRGKMPDQRTKLGNSIRIHGGGNSADWTAGCVALSDADVIDLFGRVKLGTRVEIYRSAKHEAWLAAPGRLNALILAGAKQQLKRPALYSKKAMSLLRINYPMGDIPSDHAVCTDVIVRAARRSGVDLQASVHEDRRLYPRRYRRERANYHIDHRRVRNLVSFFNAHAQKFSAKLAHRNAKPGDIVVMETGIRNGSPYDHIGVVDDQRSADGVRRVINIWTVGYRTNSMALMGQSYPTITGHYRLGHPFDYNVVPHP